MKMRISPSMMCADISKLSEVVGSLEKSNAEYLHIDIMDGLFVPNFTLGTDYCRQLRKMTDIPLDIHLMVEKPEEKLQWFEFGKGDIVSVHAESTAHLHKAVSYIKQQGADAFVALNPATPFDGIEYVLDEIEGVVVMAVNPGFAGQKMIPSSLRKIKKLRSYLDEKGFENIEIEVDGNVSFENAVKMKKAGASIFVAGSSSVFNSENTIEQGMEKLRLAIE